MFYARAQGIRADTSLLREAIAVSISQLLFFSEIIILDADLGTNGFSTAASLHGDFGWLRDACVHFADYSRLIGKGIPRNSMYRRSSYYKMLLVVRQFWIEK